MNDISLLTIVSGRGENLTRMLRGVALQHSKPREMVIVFVNEPPPPSLPDPGCPLYLHSFTAPHDGLPFAAARNFAAASAHGKSLIFLDADCIPGPSCIQRMQTMIDLTHALIVPRVLDLPASFSSDDFTYAELDQLTSAAPSPAAPESGGELTAVPYEEFNSLCFGLRAVDYARIGGYDQLYRGSGPADTDFAFSARMIQLQLLQCDARAFRQPAPPAETPALGELVANASSFYHKWQIWPMYDLLQRLEREGLIRLTKNDIQLTKQAAGRHKHGDQ